MLLILTTPQSNPTVFTIWLTYVRTVNNWSRFFTNTGQRSEYDPSSYCIPPKICTSNHFNVITSGHTTARARHDRASIGQLILNPVHPKLQPTHTRGLRTRAHRYKNVNKNLRQDILSIRVYICFNFDLE